MLVIVASASRAVKIVTATPIAVVAVSKGVIVNSVLWSNNVSLHEINVSMKQLPGDRQWDTPIAACLVQ